MKAYGILPCLVLGCLGMSGCGNATMSAPGSSTTVASGGGATAGSGSTGSGSSGSGGSGSTGSGSSSSGAGSSGSSGSGATSGSGSTSSGSSGSGSTGSGSSGAGAGGSGSSGSGSGSGGGSTPAAPKSAKRGVAYDLADSADFAVLSPGVSWWYNWSSAPNTAAPANALSQYAMDFYPMLWNGNFNTDSIEAFLKANPNVKYLLVLNEPNLTDQANMTPQAAAQLWPQYEAVAAATGVKIVGPQMNWGTMANYADPVAWLDAFYAAYEAANNGRPPEVDYLGFHWYDYGLASQLDRLDKYNVPIWVTEFANWHSQDDGAQITTLAEQEAQMTDMVSTCESRSDVFRYAWFTGRLSPDPHYTSLLGNSGQLTGLGALYLTLPFSTAAPTP